jgi:hypothetical protein
VRHHARARFGLTALLLLSLGTAACDERGVGAPDMLPPTPRPMVLAELQVNVDATTGEMRFTPVAPSAVSGDVRAQIYGDQNVNIKLYNASPSVVTTTLKTLTANVGIRNLRPHPIGDEQGAAVPTDTMGIFVFFTQEPVVTATSGACSGACVVTVKNYTGTATFDQPNRKYFYYPERLRAFGSAAGDTTLVRRAWVFEMSPQVTNFQFFVLVSAAWPAGFETTPRWKVEYEPDSVPDLGTEPVWKVNALGLGGSGTITGTAPNTVLNLRTNVFGQLFYYRRDSVLTGTNAWAEARVAVSSGPTSPQVGLGFTDGVKAVAIAFGRGRVGFVDYNSGGFIGTPTTVTVGTHTYQLRKYAADSAVFLVDGVRAGGIAYGSLGGDPSPATSPQIVFGGGAFSFNNTNTNWEFVRYEIGSPTP